MSASDDLGIVLVEKDNDRGCCMKYDLKMSWIRKIKLICHCNVKKIPKKINELLLGNIKLQFTQVKEGYLCGDGRVGRL